MVDGRPLVIIGGGFQEYWPQKSKSTPKPNIFTAFFLVCLFDPNSALILVKITRASFNPVLFPIFSSIFFVLAELIEQNYIFTSPTPPPPAPPFQTKPPNNNLTNRFAMFRICSFNLHSFAFVQHAHFEKNNHLKY